jgi:hypothetical protein
MVVAPAALRVGARLLGEVAGLVLGLALVAALGVWVARRLGRWPMFAAVDAALPTPRARAVALGFAIFALVQLGRFSMFMAAPDFKAGGPLAGVQSEHMCLTAYVRGAELASHAGTSADVYAPDRYAKGGGAGMHTKVHGMAGYMGDPFQYPTPFLLLPRATLALSGGDFLLLRTLWFALGGLAFGALALQVARASGEPLALVVLAPVVASVPVLMSFAFGQVHLIAIAAALVASVCFDERRDAAGGALLAAAVWAKLFPGVLVLVYLLRRRWTAVAWTAGFGAIYLGASLAVFGVTPHTAFVKDQLPRLFSGEAFATFAGTPEIVLANLSPPSLAARLSVMSAGLTPIQPALARALSLATIALVFVLTWRVARREPGAPAAALAGRLALLVLASVAVDYAPASYAMAPVIWLLALVFVLRKPARGVEIAGFVAVWITLQLLPYLPSLPLFWSRPMIVAVLGLVALPLVYALAIATVLRPGRLA